MHDARPRLTEWLLTREGRGNPHTRLDDRHPDGAAWSTGNLARPLVHGATYFAALADVLDGVGEGDLVCFTDWQGNPDERLRGTPGSELVEVLGRALDRGADVRALVWRSHAGRLGYAVDEHRDLGRLLQARGADVQLDMRVRTSGAHHQKFVVVRHRDDPSRDVAFVGGLDLCHTRRDDARHLGDPQGDPIAHEYGERPPWHDVQLELRGPAVHDVETVFRERWEDSTPLTRSPIRRLRDRADRLDDERRRLPAQRPVPEELGPHTVQLLRTYPSLGPGWKHDFAPRGERSVARGYTRAMRRARSLVYIEDQFLWGRAMSQLFVDALRDNPDLHVVAVLPRVPDQDGWFARDPQVLGRMRAIARVCAAAPDRVALYAPENHAGTPVYVHAKVCVIDDVWASVGSDNFCRRSWTHDSELSAVVVDTDSEDGSSTYGRRLRLALAGEHLDRVDVDALGPIGPDADEHLLDVMADCVDGRAMFRQLAASADALEAWHAGGQRGPRPPGRLRPLPPPRLAWWRRLLAAPWYALLHDPDGRRLADRLRRRL
ncbi:phospholipase D-like domain-containing protein [Aeromicrobium sp. IC_218]|uniref:phospholipase D family protein n=1 Tax=Aeromicrobium sp. IC_218 TaxID=2545468 RepID=UPI001F5FFA9F|nr:phospholipase D-like domain-containing protein [Aeromicrobium sp. IC_218]